MIAANYVTTSWRHIISNKLFSTINIMGLAIGIAAVILITLFVRDELSYDSFWSNADNIYRTHVTITPSARDPMRFVATPGPVMHALKKDFPQIEYAARYWTTEPTLIQEGKIFVEGITIVDADIINILDFNVLKGDLKSALSTNTGLVLNETLAKKYFDDTEPIGKVLTLDFNLFKRDYVVMAIIEDMPTNSQVDIKSMVLIVEEDWMKETWLFIQWRSMGAKLLYSLNPETDIQEINSQMPDFIDRNFPLQADNPTQKISSFFDIKSMNIKDFHLNAVGMGEDRVRGSMTTVITFSAIAVLILLIAIINFINLSTARASQRAKEVSLRKVVGASKKNLIIQFVGESIFLTLIGLLISLVIVELALPIYNEALGKELALSYGSSEIMLFLTFAFIVGVLGSFYPALILSSFRPAVVLKANKSLETKASVKLRMALVIIQFTVSISLFVSTAVIYGQMQFSKTIDLGYDEENLLVVRGIGRGSIAEKFPLLISEFRRIPNVQNVTWSNFVPGHVNENNASMRSDEMTREQALTMGTRRVGYDYFTTYGIELLAGRTYQLGRNDEAANFDEIRAGRGHRASIVVNQTALRTLQLGSPQEAIGKTIYSSVGAFDAEYEIIGVIADLHLESLRKTTRSEVYTLRTYNASAISIKYSGAPLSLIEDLRTIWQQEAGGIPLEYEFLTDAIAGQYQAEQGQATMLAAFSGLAILIACLGLYGLASFTAERRTKEIGIRKVMGANVFDIVKLLIWQFSKPVIIANLIAWPLSFYVMSHWLEGFVYRIESIAILWFCLLAGAVALLIAWTTVASNAISVARTNPIKALRYE
ncbi:MAG: FtsX-like permease family protein [Kordiimonadaceae bacterium]|nr:FtsX-like permease family protein [Kordiimonadaceae bacterium]